MKKIITIGLCLLLVGCANQQNGNNSTTTTTTTSTTTTTAITTPITTTTTNNAVSGELIYKLAEDVLRMINNDETFVVYLGTTTCSSCITYKPIVEEAVVENPITMYYVMMDESGMGADLLASRVDLEYTPTTYYIEAGEIVDSYVGSMSKEELIEFFKKHNQYN